MLKEHVYTLVINFPFAMKFYMDLKYTFLLGSQLSKYDINFARDNAVLCLLISSSSFKKRSSKLCLNKPKSSGCSFIP